MFRWAPDRSAHSAGLSSFSSEQLCRALLICLSGVVCCAGAVICGPESRAAGAEPAEHKRPPNFIILLADDLGYGELGCQGNPEIPTPHIDSLARRGVRFTQGYVTASYCSPSRAGLLTGKYQSRFGYENNPVGAANEDPGVGLPTDQVTLADRLLNAGYETGLIGKWHLGGTAAYHPLRRGFTEFFGFLHEGHFFVPPPYDGVSTFLRRKTLPAGSTGRWGDEVLTYSSHMGHNEPAYDANNPILRGGQPVVEQEYLTDAFTREACDFIERHQNRPFFLYLAYNAVHSPLQGPQESMAKFQHLPDLQRRIFAAMLSRLDDSVGSVLTCLDQLELTDRTVVVFLSDNGGPTRELTSSNAPLRGGKGDLYEGGVRVPFLLQWPGVVPAGQVINEPVSALDLQPTFLHRVKMTGSPRSEDGRDLMPLLTGERAHLPPVQLFWRQHQRAALRSGDWKIVNHVRPGEPPRWELFDLATDPEESRDLAPNKPEILNRLLSEFRQLAAEMP